MIAGNCKCGALGHPVDLFQRGLLAAAFSVCDACFDDALIGAEYWRREFGALLDFGLSEADANRAIIKRIESNEQPSAV